MIELEAALPALKGVVMELEDCAFPLLKGCVPTSSLDEGFKVTRMADDQVEGRPAWTVRVTDPGGAQTMFWIDQADHTVRKVGFNTPRGWHERIYSDFYMVKDPAFQRPGRVRLYYGGALVSDIRWTAATVDQPIDEPPRSRAGALRRRA